MIGRVLPLVLVGCRWVAGEVFEVAFFCCSIVAYDGADRCRKDLFLVAPKVISF